MFNKLRLQRVTRLTCDHSARSRLRTQDSVKTETVHYGFNPAINIRLNLHSTRTSVQYPFPPTTSSS